MHLFIFLDGHNGPGHKQITKVVMSDCPKHRRRNEFQSVGPDFLKSKMARQRRQSRLRDAGGCLRGDVPP